MLPKPLQQPHPPVWVAASSESAIEWAAQQGHSILMDPARRARRDRAQAPSSTASDWPRTATRSTAARSRSRACSRWRRRTRRRSEVARRGAAWIVGSYMAPAHAMIFDPTNLTGLNANPRSGRALAARLGDPRHARVGARPDRAAPRGAAARVPDVRAALARVVRAVHGAGAAEAALILSAEAGTPPRARAPRARRSGCRLCRRSAGRARPSAPRASGRRPGTRQRRIQG